MWTSLVTSTISTRRYITGFNISWYKSFKANFLHQYLPHTRMNPRATQICGASCRAQARKAPAWRTPLHLEGEPRAVLFEIGGSFPRCCQELFLPYYILFNVWLNVKSVSRTETLGVRYILNTIEQIVIIPLNSFRPLGYSRSLRS